MSILLALAAAASAAGADGQIARMAALYDEVCLKAFPDDKAVETLMQAQNAEELSADEVKVTMVDDPARAWRLQDGSATVWLEFPPYHACSVRWNADSIEDLGPYREIAARYETAIGGFRAIAPMDTNRGDIHISAIGEGRGFRAAGPRTCSSSTSRSMIRKNAPPGRRA